MENFIKQLKISNFKSIREAELECGRVNLLVGKPNVGKSNVLEALSLLGAPFNTDRKFLSDFVRYERFKNLFHFTNTDNPIVLNSNIGGAAIFHDYKGEYYTMFIGPNQSIEDQLVERLDNDSFRNKIGEANSILKTGVITIQDDGESQAHYGSVKYSPVKKYFFDSKSKIDERERSFLLPPFGKNLFSVIESNQKMKELLPDIFDEYGFEFIIDTDKSTFFLLRKENRIGYTIPYSLIADTLQRMIFYYAAIFSNKDSVILFEEPEAHSFPPYVRELALKISESFDNQYFITTHSPHLFTTLVEETPVEELAVFITYFENYETKFKKLNAEEISELLDYGIDIFFNQRWFLNEEISENPA